MLLLLYNDSSKTQLLRLSTSGSIIIFLRISDNNLKRRQHYVDKFNDDIQELVQVRSLTLGQAYDRLVDKYPYRLLAMFEFTHEERGLRSARTAQLPPVTEVILTV